MKKIKVLGIFGNVANAGQERANCDVFKILANDENHELMVLVNDRGFNWHLKPFFDQNSIPYTIIRYPWGIYKNSSLFHVLQWMFDIIRNNIQYVCQYVKFRPDYIHIGNEYMYKTLIIPLSLCRAKINFRLGDRPCVSACYNKLLWKLITRKVNRFVCDTKFIKRLLVSAGRSADRGDIVLYHPAPERKVSVTTTMPKEPGRMVFGYVGQIKESKGVRVIVETARDICSRHNNVEFWFAGNYDNDFYYSEIKPIIDNMPEDSSARVRFLGQIENIDEFFSSIDVHLAPSTAEEPYGLVLVEAKKNARPSIIFKSGGMPELINHEVDGYICKSRDVAGLTEAVEQFTPPTRTSNCRTANYV